MQRVWIYLGLLMGFMVGCRPSVVQPPADEIRIVSLTPSITESLCAIGAGDLLVGRTSACNYPTDVVTNIPVIGDFGRPSLELLASVQPTLVLDTALADESIAARISDLGMTRRRIPCDTLDDIAPMLRELGRLSGHQTQANALATELTDAIAAARSDQSSQIPDPSMRPSVYAEIWNDPLITMGSDTFLADLIRLGGGRPIIDSVTQHYFQIAPEKIIAENPEVILCLYMGPREGAAEAVKRRTGWDNISAVKNDCVFEQLNNDVLLRPGPRLLSGLATIRACVAKARERRDHDL